MIDWKRGRILVLDKKTNEITRDFHSGDVKFAKFKRNGFSNRETFDALVRQWKKSLRTQKDNTGWKHSAGRHENCLVKVMKNYFEFIFLWVLVREAYWVFQWLLLEWFILHDITTNDLMGCSVRYIFLCISFTIHPLLWTISYAGGPTILIQQALLFLAEFPIPSFWGSKPHISHIACCMSFWTWLWL